MSLYESAVDTLFIAPSPQQSYVAQQLLFSSIAAILQAAVYFITDTFLFLGRDFSEECIQFIDGFFVKRVVCPFAFFAPIHEQAVAKAFHMVGKRWLRNVELFQNDASA
jgi:hypothetical protein